MVNLWLKSRSNLGYMLYAFSWSENSINLAKNNIFHSEKSSCYVLAAILLCKKQQKKGKSTSGALRIKTELYFPSVPIRTFMKSRSGIGQHVYILDWEPEQANQPKISFRRDPNCWSGLLIAHFHSTWSPDRDPKTFQTRPQSVA